MRHTSISLNITHAALELYNSTAFHTIYRRIIVVVGSVLCGGYAYRYGECVIRLFMSKRFFFLLSFCIMKNELNWNKKGIFVSTMFSRHAIRKTLLFTLTLKRCHCNRRWLRKKKNNKRIDNKLYWPIGLGLVSALGFNPWFSIAFDQNIFFSV